MGVAYRPGLLDTIHRRLYYSNYLNVTQDCIASRATCVGPDMQYRKHSPTTEQAYSGGKEKLLCSGCAAVSISLHVFSITLEGDGNVAVSDRSERLK